MVVSLLKQREWKRVKLLYENDYHLQIICFVDISLLLLACEP